jgi:hypothetical protein
MRTVRLAGLLLLGLLAGFVLWKSLPARTASLAGADPIADLVPAPIGGMTQWLLIRGEDRKNPILLWLHGGPGSAQMPIHAAAAGLERDFVVVHWDQRGAGKSNPRGFDPRTMTLERYLADVREKRPSFASGSGLSPSSCSAIPGARCSARGWLRDGRRIMPAMSASASRSTRCGAPSSRSTGCARSLLLDASSARPIRRIHRPRIVPHCRPSLAQATRIIAIVRRSSLICGIR